ncbi:hypothetical protein V5O48_017739 [Marasmius crinis-equi]|uniref:Uncharacterized protein n=1 Tax=Marasmius crinis-equi TaxID=585013 RepID=A0ABR3ENB3_9AGAR
MPVDVLLVKDYKSHKDICNIRANKLKEIEQLRTISPHLAQCVDDWLQFQSAALAADKDSLIYALRLKDQSGRGSTHIVLKKMGYEPKEKDVLDRFKAVAAGVFRIEDISDDLDRLMSFSTGEFKHRIRDMLEQRVEGKDGGFYMVVMFLEDPRLAQFCPTFMGSGSIRGEDLRNMKPNSDWRSLMNRKGGPPAPLRLESGAKDAEHDMPSCPLVSRDETAVDFDHEVENPNQNISDTWSLPLLQELGIV